MFLLFPMLELNQLMSQALQSLVTIRLAPYMGRGCQYVLVTSLPPNSFRALSRIMLACSELDANLSAMLAVPGVQPNDLASFLMQPLGTSISCFFDLYAICLFCIFVIYSYNQRIADCFRMQS